MHIFIADKLRQSLRRKDLLLVPVLGLAFYMAFIPNLGYQFPVHVDEWLHIVHANSLMAAGSVHYADPFYGVGTGGIVGAFEAGFHALTGIFQRLSGLSWETIVRFGPGVIFMFTIATVYLLARREGYGLAAAFFACLIPSTVGVLGPAFFVPMVLCLPLICLVLYLAFYHRSAWSYVTIALLAGFIIVAHAPSAILLALLMLPVTLVYLKWERKHGLVLLLMVVLPFLVSLPWTFTLIRNTFATLFQPRQVPYFVEVPRIIGTYGELPLAIGLLGIFLLTLKSSRRELMLMLGLFVLVFMLTMYFSLHYGIETVYLRGITVMLLVFSFIAGAGLSAIWKLRVPETFKIRAVFRPVGYVVAVAIVVAVLVIAIPARLAIPYYHMINESDYQTFVWVRDNLDSRYAKAVLDPWQGIPFVAVTGKITNFYIQAGPSEYTGLASEFLANGCVDDKFLSRYDISIVITHGPMDNPDLVEVAPSVYVVKELKKPAAAVSFDGGTVTRSAVMSTDGT